ncbi:MAG: hypothetical protein AAF569_01900 [Pseudomonadota bacterium]
MSTQDQDTNVWTIKLIAPDQFGLVVLEEILGKAFGESARTIGNEDVVPYKDPMPHIEWTLCAEVKGISSYGEFLPPVRCVIGHDGSYQYASSNLLVGIGWNSLRVLPAQKL